MYTYVLDKSRYSILQVCTQKDTTQRNGMSRQIDRYFSELTQKVPRGCCDVMSLAYAYALTQFDWAEHVFFSFLNFLIRNLRCQICVGSTISHIHRCYAELLMVLVQVVSVLMILVLLLLHTTDKLRNKLMN